MSTEHSDGKQEPSDEATVSNDPEGSESSDPEINEPEPSAEIERPSEEERVSEPATEAQSDPGTSETTGAQAEIQETEPVAPSDQEELPDWDELTPELMADECLRGDFMLRWAAILLAVLLGWSYITESIVLVQIRSGERIAKNGYLPSATDQFSAVENRPWSNLHWLSDVVLSTVHQAADMRGLTVLCAVVTGLAFWILSRVSLPDVSTWWASICSVAAIVALFPMLQPGPTSFTVVLLAILVAILNRWTLNPESATAWLLPVLFVVWANVAPTAIFAAAFVVLFAVINVLTRGLKPSAFAIAGVSAVCAMCVHPQPLSPLWEVWNHHAASLEAQAYGGLGEHFKYLAYGLMHEEFWQVINPFTIAAVGLWIVSFLMIFLNASRLNFGWFAVWAGANGLGLIYGEWVCYAAIINCAVSALNGQEWYRASFSSEYKIDSWSVFSGRAGRAVTVLGFFALAYVSVNGILTGPAGRRIGTGLDPRWQNRIQSLEEDVLAHPYGDSMFPTRSDIGDLLIWLGKRPFIDSRFDLYVGTGDDNLLARHRDVRAGLFAGDEGVPVWSEAFDQFQLTDVVARLWGEDPAYDPFVQLMVSEHWGLTGLGAAGANFTRSSTTDADVQTHIFQHRATKFVEQAFPAEGDPQASALSPTWPRPISRYDQWLYQALPATPNSIQLARHYVEIQTRLFQFLNLQQAGALSHLAIQLVRDGLIEAPNDPLAYRVLSNAYLILGELELQIASLSGATSGLPMRAQQATYAAYHAATASGNAPADLVRLFQILLNQQNLDGALSAADAYERITGKPISGEQDAADGDQADPLDELRAHVESVQEQIADARGPEVTPSELSVIALNGRCPNLALTLMEENLAEVAQDPAQQLAYATILLDTGRTESAWEEFERMEQLFASPNTPLEVAPIVSRWRNMTALANLAASDTDRASKLWADDADMQARSTMNSLLRQKPFVGNTSPEEIDMWATMMARMGYSAMIEFPERWSQLRLQQALVELESGRASVATEILKSILDEHPEYSMRPIVAFYLGAITGTEYEVSPPSNWIPVWGEMFAPDEPDDDGAEPAEGGTKPAASETVPADSRPAPARNETEPANADAESPSPPAKPKVPLELDPSERAPSPSLPEELK